MDRRNDRRKPVDIFFNKFLEGYPYLCRAIDVSPSGVLVETYAEPEMDADRFPLELRLPGDDDTLWIWARRVRRHGKTQALEFVSTSQAVKQRLHEYVAAPN